MSNRTTRIKADAIEHWVPRDRDEVNEAIAQIGADHRERSRVKADLNDRIEAIKAEAEAVVAPINERIQERSKGVKLWCEANRSELTRGDKVKFHDFATGAVKWRLTPWAVGRISKVQALIDRLKAMGQTQYIRSKEEINKDALLLDRAALQAAGSGIDGITFTQEEEFVIVPSESQLEEVQP
jgi:phage host-nuclease inhibitor protein Gam